MMLITVMKATQMTATISKVGEKYRRVIERVTEYWNNAIDCSEDVDADYGHFLSPKLNRSMLCGNLNFSPAPT